MDHVIALWLPIIVSAVLVFVASSVIHMVLGYHRNDYRKLPSEDAVMESLQQHDLPPGDYMVPHISDPKVMEDPAFKAKMEKGPLGFFTVVSDWAMGTSLLQWFVYCLVVSTFSGVLTSQATHETFYPGEVFHFAALISFACYFLGLVQNSIWFKRSWKITLKYLLDSVVYAAATGAAFMWLWPGG